MIFWLSLYSFLIGQTNELLHEARSEYALRNAASFKDLNPPLRVNFFSSELAKKRGDYWQKLAAPPDPQRALNEFRQAVEFDPNDSVHWLDYALTCEQTSHPQEALKAIVLADALDPENHMIQKAIGDFFLYRGIKEKALHHHARAIHLEPSLARNIYPLYWSLGLAPTTVAQALLDGTPELSHQYWLDALVSSEPEEAGRLWEHLSKTPGLMDEGCYREYFNYLIGKKRMKSAATLWNRIAREFYREQWDQAKEPFWNGDCDHPLKFEGGLEWQAPDTFPVGVSWTFGVKNGPGAAQGLRITFAGTGNISLSGIRHGFFVEPGKSYQLTFHTKTTDITTQNGPYVRALIYGTKPVVKYAPVATGTEECDQTLEFTTPADGGWGEIGIFRDWSDKFNNKIMGEVIYQHFDLAEKKS